MSFAIVNSYAEKKDETWTKNLNVELSLNTSTPSKDNLPFSSILDVNYGLKRFSIHALVDGTYFLPKENITKNYNNTFNLGGGVGFEIFPRDINDPNIFEIRASVARSLGTSDYRNTAYKIGLQWLLKPNRRCLVPTVGVGYCLRHFSEKHIHTYNGIYISIGIRF